MEHVMRHAGHVAPIAYHLALEKKRFGVNDFVNGTAIFPERFATFTVSRFARVEHSKPSHDGGEEERIMMVANDEEEDCQCEQYCEPHAHCTGGYREVLDSKGQPKPRLFRTRTEKPMVR